MEESLLTEYVRADLEKIGYTTYAEVCVKGAGAERADMYARCEDPISEQYKETIAFEAKLIFNLKVLEQAYFWKNRATHVYVLIPSTNKNLKTRKFMRELCKLLGIGVMEVNIEKEQYHVTVKSTKCDNPKVPELYPEQRMIIASNSGNIFMTPFKRTVSRLEEYFKDKQFAYISEVVKNVEHHYKSDIKANRNIKIMIEKKIIKGFYIVQKNHKIVIGKIII